MVAGQFEFVGLAIGHRILAHHIVHIDCQMSGCCLYLPSDYLKRGLLGSSGCTASGPDPWRTDGRLRGCRVRSPGKSRFKNSACS